MSELIKNILFDEDCREKLIAGITKVAKAVGSTMGPAGKTVIIESPEHTKGLTVTKDGYNVAKSINLLDPVENIAVRILKEAAYNSAATAGDGTSAAIVIARALIDAGNNLIKKGNNQTQVLRYLAEIADDVIKEMQKDVIECTDDILLDVATISANNDPITGGIIADTYKEVGKNGLVSIGKSSSAETYVDVTSGIKVERGYSSPLFINNREKEQCIMEDVLILVCETEITQLHQLTPILKGIVPEGKRLLVIAPCNSNTLNSMVANAITTDPSRPRLNICAIQPPSFGYKLQDLMQDIALSVGATYFSQQTDNDLSRITMDDLGFAKKVIVSRSTTEIMGGGGDEAKIKEAVEQLTKLKEHAKNKDIKDFASERIASLTGGVAIIYAGGNTDMEQKELYDRIEDSICAVRSALEEGIVPGAGKCLYEVNVEKVGDADYEVAKQIILQAIKTPLIQILANADLNYADFYGSHTPKGVGLNVKTMQIGDLVGMGVIDPFKVVRTSLLNAISVANTILSTNASINIVRA
jgi:chaperonin GroEL